MPRSLTLTALALAAATATLSAQNRSLGFGRADWCDTFGDNRRASHCEIQEATVASASSFDVDANANGGIAVRGWDRQDAHVRARISAVADSDARARQIVAGVRLTTDGGRIRAEGPSLGDNEHWSVSFELQVPRDARMNLEARNGGIAIENFQGTATFRTVNGGIAVTDVSGDMRGETTNGDRKSV